MVPANATLVPTKIRQSPWRGVCAAFCSLQRGPTEGWVSAAAFDHHNKKMGQVNWLVFTTLSSTLESAQDERWTQSTCKTNKISKRPNEGLHVCIYVNNCRHLIFAQEKQKTLRTRLKVQQQMQD